MLKLIRVAGESLSPEYREGDYAVVLTRPFLRPVKRGDTVLLRLDTYGTLIKKVESIDLSAGTLEVVGSSLASVDSRTFGAVSLEDLVGRVIFHIKKPLLKRS